MFYPTLYKRTSTGAIQIWKREVDGSRYRTISGQIDGKQVTSAWTECIAKNVGRSNEVSAEEQAHREVEADYTKKLAQGGYHESVDAIDEAKFFKPMLAKDYTKYPITNFKGKRIYSQPKLDGVRCIVTKDGMWSRTGKPIPGAPHIHEELTARCVFEDNPDFVFDGELYADKFSDDFNEIIRLVKKQSDDKERRAKSAEHIQYHIYDFWSPTALFGERFEMGCAILGHYSLPSIVLVQTDIVADEDHLNALYASYMANGYEGQMVRHDAKYKNSRSGDLLKRKEFQDQEYKIVSINEGIGNRAGMAGSITYELGDGRTFDSGIKGSFAFATQLLKERDLYPGGQGTVRFQNLTPDGIPRFPITVALYAGARDI